MVYVHFLINKSNIEHIIALDRKKSNEKLGKNRETWESIENVWEAARKKSCRLPWNLYFYKIFNGCCEELAPVQPVYCSICTSNPSPRSVFA